MKIGILVGMENTFPPAVIEKINSLNAGVTAEYLKVGGVREAEASEYKVILDRISHEIPFYRSMLKNAVLNGTIVVNNPFWWSADDKFFNYSLAKKLGVTVPKTVLLPQRGYIEGVKDESLRNLEFPLDWQGIVDYIGLPAFMKPHDGGGWKHVYKVHSLEELWHYYNQTGTLCMVLQEFIDFTEYVRCYCVGRRKVLVMRYDPKNRCYLSPEEMPLTQELEDRIVRETLLLNEALGYDMNTVEFAVRDGIPYAIDFMNPAPDADIWSVTEQYHHWFVDAIAEMLVDYAKNGVPTLRYHRWNRFLDQDAEGESGSGFSGGGGGSLDRGVSATAPLSEEQITPIRTRARSTSKAKVTAKSKTAAKTTSSIVKKPRTTRTRPPKPAVSE